MTIPYQREREQIRSCPYRQHHTASRLSSSPVKRSLSVTAMPVPLGLPSP